MTLRAIDCLRSADVIAVENPKRSLKLLSHYGIKAPLLVYREANREKKSREIVARLKEGATVAFITDAGMPAVSDPGIHLVKLLQEENLPYTVVPGPSAALTALLISGYPARRFVFWGYLSRKKKDCRRELRIIAAEEKPVIIYESPHRLRKTIEEMQDIIGDREIAVCRELTKKHEEVVRGTAGELAAVFADSPPRGEITVVVSPVAGKLWHSTAGGGVLYPTAEELKERLLKALQSGLSPAQAVRRVAGDFPISRSEVYKLMMEIKSAQKNK